MKIFNETIVLTVNAFLAGKRKELGIEQEELAIKLGCEARKLSYLESGKKSVKLDFLEKWVTELGLEVEIKIKGGK